MERSHIEYKIEHGVRILAFLINIIPVVWFINIYTWWAYNNTVTGLIFDYEFLQNTDERKVSHATLRNYLVHQVLLVFLYIITLSIFFWLDIGTIVRKNGNFAEHWTNIHKAQKGSHRISGEPSESPVHVPSPH